MLQTAGCETAGPWGMLLIVYEAAQLRPDPLAGKCMVWGWCRWLWVGEGVSHSRVAAGYQIRKGHCIQGGAVGRAHGSERSHQTPQGQIPSVPGPALPPRQDCSSANEHAPVTRPHARSYAFCRFFCPGQPLVLTMYQTLHTPCRVLGGGCNRPAWATRIGVQEPCRDRAFARRRRKCQSGTTREKEREKLCVTLFYGCLFIINSVHGILLFVVDMLHGGV